MKFSVKPRPVEGDVRLVKRFAWLPFRIEETVIIWLEPYWTVETYECVDYSNYDAWYYERWQPLFRSLSKTDAVVFYNNLMEARNESA